MPSSVWSPAVQSAITEAMSPSQRRVRVGRRQVSIPTPFPSPADWRDHWIYFLLIDRFNNPAAPPRHLPFDGEHGVFQGGTFAGVTAQLDYLRELGVGAIWLSPVAKNCPFEDTTYHGYGFQDFLAIEPRFASDPQAARRDPELAERELRELVDAAHARSLYRHLRCRPEPRGQRLRLRRVRRDGAVPGGPLRHPLARRGRPSGVRGLHHRPRSGAG
jgi:hypothetical protein